MKWAKKQRIFQLHNLCKNDFCFLENWLDKAAETLVNFAEEIKKVRFKH